ncbi:MAG TPA: NADH-quinone oxidoreductase subunit NuoK [Ktedonobacterales bacterium]|jgi:NADH:ubiquinone oxidoreductase subunit K
MAVNLYSFLVLGALLFAIGLFGALSRRNAVSILMSIEIMLNAVNITLVAFASAFIGKTDAAGQAVGARLTGQIFAVFIITVAAAEAAVALAMIIAIYRRRSTIDVGEINLMRW